uniref:Uncharacterized protein n=1 Tax=Ciona intestinalis TaxID=7719 RepID=H2Y2A3_CIOIN
MASHDRITWCRLITTSWCRLYEQLMQL